MKKIYPRGTRVLGTIGTLGIGLASVLCTAPAA